MAMKLLGTTIDLHAGGIDNMFPHHENEIAQSEACSGKPFVKTWLHAEHLIVDNKKMSKSFGNFYTLRDLLERGYSGVQVRYMLLQTHYKTQLNFTFMGLDAVKSALNRLNDFIQRLQEIQATGHTEAADKIVERAVQNFSEALADDLNISAALASLFDLVREVNVLIDAGKILNGDAKKILEVLKKFDTVLCIFDFKEQHDAIPSELAEALTKRLEARKEKNWALADSLRDFILSKGYVIEDTPSGARLKKGN
jgi:cysteinyl-tRNA synthetase